MPPHMHMHTSGVSSVTLLLFSGVSDLVQYQSLPPCGLASRALTGALARLHAEDCADAQCASERHADGSGDFGRDGPEGGSLSGCLVWAQKNIERASDWGENMS